MAENYLSNGPRHTNDEVFDFLVNLSLLKTGVFGQWRFLPDNKPASFLVKAIRPEHFKRFLTDIAAEDEHFRRNLDVVGIEKAVSVLHDSICVKNELFHKREGEEDHRNYGGIIIRQDPRIDEFLSGTKITERLRNLRIYEEVSRALGLHYPGVNLNTFDQYLIGTSKTHDGAIILGQDTITNYVIISKSVMERAVEYAAQIDGRNYEDIDDLFNSYVYPERSKAEHVMGTGSRTKNAFSLSVAARARWMLDANQQGDYSKVYVSKCTVKGNSGLGSIVCFDGGHPVKQATINHIDKKKFLNIVHYDVSSGEYALESHPVSALRNQFNS